MLIFQGVFGWYLDGCWHHRGKEQSGDWDWAWHSALPVGSEKSSKSWAPVFCPRYVWHQILCMPTACILWSFCLNNLYIAVATACSTSHSRPCNGSPGHEFFNNFNVCLSRHARFNYVKSSRNMFGRQSWLRLICRFGESLYWLRIVKFVGPKSWQLLLFVMTEAGNVDSQGKPVSDATRNERKDIWCWIFRAPERHCGREPGSAYGGIPSKCKCIVNYVFRWESWLVRPL